MQRQDKFEASHSDEGRYRMLVEAVTDYAIYMLDANGIVTSWNPGARRFKGYEEHEILGRHFSEFYTEEDRKTGLPVRALATAVREGKFEAEGWRVRKDGTKFWAFVIIDPIRDTHGNLIGFAKVTRDLTERRQAELILRESQEQFRLLVQGVTDYAIYMLTPEGIVRSWNAGAERIKGYKPEEIIGEHFSRFYTNEDRLEDLPKIALETANRDGRFEKEGMRVRKDGTKFWANVVIDPIRDENGVLIGFAKITRDISERKKTEEALEKTREALVQAQKMEAIGHLTGGIAHDFNNLLMAIQGSLELLKRRLSTDDPKITQFLNNAMQGANRGTALTQRMLAFARRQELKLSALDVSEAVVGMTSLLQSSLSPSVSIDTHFPPDLPKAYADSNQFELAVLNLAMNARDAMPTGGAIVIRGDHVEIKNELGLKPGQYICVSVTDSGMGMDEHTLAHAMEPFFTTKGVGKGTGLGLPMVHGMAQQSGGKLRLKSKIGEGTVAELCLPVARDAAEPAAEAVGSADDVPSRKLLILSVDDDPLVALNTTALLEELGHQVYEVSSAIAALDILRAKNIDLLITDQAMPVMTGLDLVKAARKMNPELPAIIATGYAELPDGLANSIHRLAKPFSQRELIGAIDAAVVPTSHHGCRTQ